MLHLSPYWNLPVLIARLLIVALALVPFTSTSVGQDTPVAAPESPSSTSVPEASKEPSPTDSATGQNPAQGTSGQQAKTYVDFKKDIVPLLEKHCQSCHQGEDPEGGFLIADRDAVLGYITAGSASDSSLWNDYLTAPSKTINKDSLVMPPDGPLPMSDLALIKLWIDEGASWPEDVRIGEVVPAVPLGGSVPVRAYRAVGYLHPAVVHFPIAFLSLSGACVALSFLFGQRLIPFAYACLVLGAMGAVVSAIMGWSFADIRGLADWTTMITSDATEKESNEFFHRWLGTFTAVAAVLVAWFGHRARQPDGKRPGYLWKIGALVLALLVGIVGHQGGELVYGDIFAKARELFMR